MAAHLTMPCDAGSKPVPYDLAYQGVNRPVAK